MIVSGKWIPFLEFSLNIQKIKLYIFISSDLSEYEQDKIDLTRGMEDSILGGALCSGTPVLFTKNLGLVTISATDFASQDFNQ